ncbi:hypothetical protein AB4212_51475, partial [Streptomyces sp. 2MCAF27]
MLITSEGHRRPPLETLVSPPLRMKSPLALTPLTLIVLWAARTVRAEPDGSARARTSSAASLER